MEPVALISGASRGIGRAAAIALAARGYRLALLARGEGQLRETARLANALDALVMPADVTDAGAVERCVAAVMQQFGRIDALVNVAGVAPVRTIREMGVEEWRATIETNLSAVFYLTKFAWARLKETRGVIVNISSLASRDPFAGFAAYGAAKAAVNIFSLVAAREGDADGIRVHTIAPGAVETEMFRGILSAEQYPSEKCLTPAEVAGVIVQCVTGELRHASGEVIYLHKTV